MLPVLLVVARHGPSYVRMRCSGYGMHRRGHPTSMSSVSGAGTGSGHLGGKGDILVISQYWSNAIGILGQYITLGCSDTRGAQDRSPRHSTDDP